MPGITGGVESLNWGREKMIAHCGPLVELHLAPMLGVVTQHAVDETGILDEVQLRIYWPRA